MLVYPIVGQFIEYEATCCKAAKDKLLWEPQRKSWYHFDDRFDEIFYCPFCGAKLETVFPLKIIAERWFPIQGAGAVPWKEAEKAYETYMRLFGKTQTLERLAERCGFGISEFCLLWVGKNPIRERPEEIEKAIVRVALELRDKWKLSTL